MQVRLHYKGVAAPQPPSFSVSPPTGWQQVTIAGAALAAAEEHRPGHFRANLTVTLGPVPRDATLQDIGALLLQRISTREEFTLIGDLPSASLAGQRARIREWAFRTGPGGPTVWQAEALLFGPRTHAEQRDLVQLHGSCAGDEVATTGAALRAAMQTFMFEDDDDRPESATS